MTEAEWSVCAHPSEMLESLRYKVSDRKLRLFACGCCRRFPHLLNSNDTRRTLEFAEMFADGLKTVNELHGNSWGKSGEAGHLVLWTGFDAASCSSENWIGRAANESAKPYPDIDADWNAAFEVEWNRGMTIAESCQIADDSAPFWFVATKEAARTSERLGHSNLLRDIFGNPFRPVALDPRWLSSTVLDLARIIYDARVFERLPILADALMDAGCDNEEILSHCRSAGPHVRGCWAVDLLLGKE